MQNDKIDLIEKSLKLKNIEEYEILFVDRMNYETIFLKANPETKREIKDFEYIIRILTQKGDQTGIGVVKGNALDSKEISKNIDVCELISRNNISSKYHFPEKKIPQEITIAEDKILKDPEGYVIEIETSL